MAKTKEIKVPQLDGYLAALEDVLFHAYRHESLTHAVAAMKREYRRTIAHEHSKVKN